MQHAYPCIGQVNEQGDWAATSSTCRNWRAGPPGNQQVTFTADRVHPRVAMGSGRRIAVVGSGITGLSAAWLLNRNGDHVTLYESDASCGGHTLTDASGPWPVDLGFQVYNLTTYPNLVGFLEELGVDTEPSDMSFSLSIDGGNLEWASHDLNTIFAQRSNLGSPAFLRMIYDVVRFGQEAPKVLDPANQHIYQDMALSTYLQQQGYSEFFQRNYLLPMCAAVWSVPNAQVLEFPVQMLVRFWVNHHLLDLVQRPCWRVVKGRSRNYVNKVLEALPDVRTSTPVASVVRTSKGVEVTSVAGKTDCYDAVVLATHSDISLQLLGKGATDQEREVLSAIPYNANDIYLHTDATLMPVRRTAWASWNFLGSSGDSTDTSPVCVSYWLNRLQNLPPEAPQMFVTLNPPRAPAADKVIRRLSLAHPVYSFASYKAQAQVPAIQGKGGVYFAGAWCSYGFHEDGIKAATAVVKLLGAPIPWPLISTSPKMGPGAMFFFSLFDKFASTAIKTGQLRLILPNGEERLYGSAESVPPQVPAGEEWRGLPRRAATLRVLNMDLFRKIVVRHDVGMGEAYMDKDYLVDDLGAYLALVVANARNLEGSKGALGVANWLGEKLLLLAHLQRSNTREGSRKNIEEHYDAGNAMYSLFLDPSMTYSCGIHSPGGSLQEAQMAKLDAVIDAAQLGPNDHVLEIGCGWGSFAMRAVQRSGCRVTGLTLSKEQLAEATERVRKAGLQDNITLLFCDYRDCPGLGTYDKVVSIEMIEAVGHEHLRSYFATINAALKPGGRAVIQVIAQPDERYDSYCHSSDFIREHIFPGGHLPSMGAMVEAARGTQLSVHSIRDIGPDYAITLRAWRSAWEEHHQEILDLGYSERFWLKYHFYFAYCEAAFDARYIHDFHVTWVKGGSTAAKALSATPTASAPASTSSASAAGAGAASVPAAALGERLKEELPSDPVTQVLLALYFFLAGLLVQRHPYLWIMPLASTAAALLQGATHLLARLAWPSYALLTPARQTAWCWAVVECVAGAAGAAAAVAVVLQTPLQTLLALQPTPAAAAHQQQLPVLLCCAAAGYFAFQLWLAVRTRGCFGTEARAVGVWGGFLPLATFTLLLVLFGVGAYKGEHIALLAAPLVCGAAAVPAAARALVEVKGPSSSGGSWSKGLMAAERLLFIVCRLVPQVLLAVLLVLRASTFSSTAYWAVALFGSCYCHCCNYAAATKLFRRSQLASKAHTA